MGLTEIIVKKISKPTGILCRFMASVMNYAHKVAGWGLRHLSIHKNDIILDVSCSRGKTIKTMVKIATEGKVYGIDYSKTSVAVASKANKKLIKADKVEILYTSVESIPFPKTFFDLVTAIESYYFWPDLTANLKEI
ncbi:MAG: class I SAM-dependent methyltransferase [Actinomycetota bacterium]|nr:class I SAM-dependent methyltransferase [Actinomycetota bacterium]